MKISIGTNNHSFSPVEVDFNGLIEYAQKYNYSPGVYKDNHRNNANFVEAYTIGFDIDNEQDDMQCTIERAAELFKDYKHIIMPTKSHQKPKGEKGSRDRYRIILFLENKIDNSADFTATWFSIARMFPFVDDSCKDAARYFYPSAEIYSKNPNGKLVRPVKYKAPEKKSLDLDDYLKEDGPRGQLSKSTLTFLFQGAADGTRHNSLNKAAIDMHEQGYTKEECIMRVENMIKMGGSWGFDHLTDKHLRQIDHAYSREPRYHKREGEINQEKPFQFVKAFDLEKVAGQVEWFCEDLLTRGGLSVLAGPPKQGKSTLMKQLCIAAARGEEFLGRNVKKSRVRYLALEEQSAVLNKQFKLLGIRPDDDIGVHYGSPITEANVKDVEDMVVESEADLLIIDTFFDIAVVESTNNYGEVKRAMAEFRNIARKTNCHILVVHHTNKSDGEGANKIMGSQAIHGGVDCAMIFTSEDRRRYFTSSQRDGIPFYDQELLFDFKTQSYSLGKAKEYKGGLV